MYSDMEKVKSGTILDIGVHYLEQMARWFEEKSLQVEDLLVVGAFLGKHTHDIDGAKDSFEQIAQILRVANEE